MARKTILPKKLGPLKIPKTLRRLSDKALSDPQVVTILSGALASMAAAVAARKVAQEDSGDAALARSAASSKALGSVTEVVRQALKDAVQVRYPAPPVEEIPQPAEAKPRKAKPGMDASASAANGEASEDQLH